MLPYLWESSKAMALEAGVAAYATCLRRVSSADQLSGKTNPTSTPPLTFTPPLTQPTANLTAATVTKTSPVSSARASPRSGSPITQRSPANPTTASPSSPPHHASSGAAKPMKRTPSKGKLADEAARKPPRPRPV